MLSSPLSSIRFTQSPMDNIIPWSPTATQTIPPMKSRVAHQAYLQRLTREQEELEAKSSRKREIRAEMTYSERQRQLSTDIDTEGIHATYDLSSARGLTNDAIAESKRMVLEMEQTVIMVRFL